VPLIGELLRRLARQLAGRLVDLEGAVGKIEFARVTGEAPKVLVSTMSAPAAK